MTTLIPKFDLKNGGSTPAGAVNRTIYEKLSDFVSIKDFGAVGDGTTNDTAAIQAAINSGNLNILFPAGVYAVTNIATTVAGQAWLFQGGAYIKGIASSATTSVVTINQLQCSFTNLFVNGNYNTNYTAAIQICAVDATHYAHKTYFSNLIIVSSLTGILYGAITSPVNQPVSENHIVGGYTRDVQKVIFSNQPNGFLFVTNFTLDAQIYEWLGTPSFPTLASWYTNAVALQNLIGWFAFNNCEFLKGQSGEGYVFNNADHLLINGGTCEASCTHFIGTICTDSTITSSNHINGYQVNYFNSTAPFIQTYSGSTGYFEGVDIQFARGAGGESYFPAGVVNTTNCTGWIFKFTNCHFINQNIPSLFSSNYTGYQASNSLSSIDFKACHVKNPSGVEVDVSFSDSNLAWYYADTQDIARWTVTTTGGSAAAVIANVTLTGYFTKVLQLTGDTSQTCTASTKYGIDQAIKNQKRMMTIEFWHQSTTNNFDGLLTVLYYENGSFLGSVELGDNSGAVANIPHNSGAPVTWKKVQFVIPQSNQATELVIRFTARNVSQVWQIGNIVVY